MAKYKRLSKKMLNHFLGEQFGTCASIRGIVKTLDCPFECGMVNMCDCCEISSYLCTVDISPVFAAIHTKYGDWKEFLVKRLTGARTLPHNFYDKVLCLVVLVTH